MDEVQAWSSRVDEEVQTGLVDRSSRVDEVQAWSSRVDEEVQTGLVDRSSRQV